MTLPRRSDPPKTDLSPPATASRSRLDTANLFGQGLISKSGFALGSMKGKGSASGMGRRNVLAARNRGPENATAEFGPQALFNRLTHDRVFRSAGNDSRRRQARVYL